MRTAKRLDPCYVTGFVEGAGSFTFNRSRDRITMVFAVRMRAPNRALLEQLRSFLGGAGKIYDTRRSTTDSHPEREACFFRVNRDRELLRVVEHFDAYPLRGAKREAFRIWREMVFLRATHHGSRPATELEDLAVQLARATHGTGTGPQA